MAYIDLPQKFSWNFIRNFFK